MTKAVLVLVGDAHKLQEGMNYAREQGIAASLQPIDDKCYTPELNKALSDARGELIQQLHGGLKADGREDPVDAEQRKRKDELDRGDKVAERGHHDPRANPDDLVRRDPHTDTLRGRPPERSGFAGPKDAA